MSQKHSHTLSLSTVAYLGFGKGAPPEAETVFGNRKFAHFSEIWKRKRPSNIVEFCNSCWKMAKKAPFRIKSLVKNFHGRAKGGHRTVAPLNTPLCTTQCVRLHPNFCWYPLQPLLIAAELTSRGNWLHTEMVYLPADGHPSKYQPGLALH